MLEHAFVTSKGDREKNEDSVYAGSNEHGFMAVVADGLGRQGHGDIASKIVVNTFRENGFPSDSEEIKDTLSECKSALRTRIGENAIYSSMSSTVVFCYIRDMVLYGGFVGDSRLYLFRNNKFLFRTQDHSIPQMLVHNGKIKEKQIRNHPDRNRLLKVINAANDPVFVEFFKPTQLQSGDAILLCSDGLWENVLEKDMEIGLRKTQTVSDWCDYITYVARKTGIGHNMDNYTAVAIRV